MTNIFRKGGFVPLHEERQQLVDAIKNKAGELYELMCKLNNREIVLGKTNLEQAVMWAVKGVTANPNEPLKAVEQDNAV